MMEIKTDEVKNGIAGFTFDDRNFPGWQNAVPLFREYHAHASFFFCGPIDQAALNCMEQLRSNGHTVGLHTLDHVDAPEFFLKESAECYFREQIQPQLDPCRKAGFQIGSFAYPNNLRNEETDRFLSRYFHHFRSGCRNLPDNAFIPVSHLAEHRVMYSRGIGMYYQTRLEDLLEALEHAAEANLAVSFFSHNISPGATGINMPTEILEACLKKASGLGMNIIGFDELPETQTRE